MTNERRRWYRIENKAAETKTAAIRLYDEIGGWFGVYASDFVRDLDALEDVEQIDLHISSPGGDVFDAIAIKNALVQHPAKVVVTVDSLAASAASVVAMAGDEIVMAPNSEMMIHEAWGYAMGNAGDMTKMAADLDRVSNNLASIYADRAGGDTKTWRKAMTDETWYSADEAVDAGLADRKLAKPEPNTAAEASFDLSKFRYQGRARAPRPVNAAPSGDPTEGGSPVALTDDQMSTLRDKLGVTDEAADGDAILAALEEALAEQAEPAPVAAKLPDGIVAIDKATLDGLRAQASAGAKAREQQETEERERIVNAAVNDGRIAPARRAHWVAQLAADPGAADVLASLEKGLIPVGDPVGYTGGPAADAASDDDAVYNSLFATKGA